MSVKSTIENAGTTLTSNSKYFMATELAIFIILILLAYKWDILHLATDYPAQTNLFFLVTGFVMIVSFYFIKERLILFKDTPTLGAFLMKVGGTLLAIAVLLFLIVAIFWLFKNITSLTTLLTSTMNLFLIIGGIGILYLLLKPLIKAGKENPKSMFSLLGNLVMYIPCLLISFIDFIREQYHITTKTVWILLAIEIILIIFSIIVPKLMHSLATHDGTQLLNEPIYLNNEHTLGNFENLHAGSSDDSKFNYHYSLSSWIYINPQPPNTSSAYTKFTSLLNYGDKPQIQFNGLKNELRIMATTGKNDLVEIYKTTDIAYQKWNNFVINYDGGNMDVFLNGELVASRPNIAPYMTYENITSGSNNGIEGGICNVMYYDHILSKGAITLAYRMLRDKKLPLL
jgi:hypothetical protein